MNKKRRRFITNFKAKVALEAAKELKTVKKLSKQFELSPSQIVKRESHLVKQLPEFFGHLSNRLTVDFLFGSLRFSFVCFWLFRNFQYRSRQSIHLQNIYQLFVR